MKMFDNIYNFICGRLWAILCLVYYWSLSKLSGRFESQYIRNLYIYREFYTDRGKNELATSMVEPKPIRRALDYQGIGRRLLMVAELPQGAYANYTTTTTAAVNNAFLTSAFLTNQPNRNGDVFENPATEEDIARVREQLAYFSWQNSYNITEQENALYDYLFYEKTLEEENKMAERRKQVKNSIMELGG